MLIFYKLPIFWDENLEHSYHFGDEESREKMHNASTMASMAFANAFPWYQPLTSSCLLYTSSNLRQI